MRPTDSAQPQVTPISAGKQPEPHHGNGAPEAQAQPADLRSLCHAAQGTRRPRRFDPAVRRARRPGHIRWHATAGVERASSRRSARLRRARHPNTGECRWIDLGRPVGRARGRRADCSCADELRPCAGRVGAVGPAVARRCAEPARRRASGVDQLPGDEIVVLTWLRLSPRDELSTHPEDDMSQPLTGVFSTCSPNRPNPIGLHRARIVARDGLGIEVDALEAIDGTPVVDVKPAIDPPA